MQQIAPIVFLYRPNKNGSPVVEEKRLYNFPKLFDNISENIPRRELKPVPKERRFFFQLNKIVWSCQTFFKARICSGHDTIRRSYHVASRTLDSLQSCHRNLLIVSDSLNKLRCMTYHKKID